MLLHRWRYLQAGRKLLLCLKYRRCQGGAIRCHRCGRSWRWRWRWSWRWSWSRSRSRSWSRSLSLWWWRGLWSRLECSRCRRHHSLRRHALRHASAGLRLGLASFSHLAHQRVHLLCKLLVSVNCVWEERVPQTLSENQAEPSSAAATGRGSSEAQLTHLQRTSLSRLDILSCCSRVMRFDQPYWLQMQMTAYFAL
jgi:hypothetical protein